MNCCLPSRIPSSNHGHIEILHESRLPEGSIKDTYANKALQGGNIEALVLGSGRNEDGGRSNFAAIRQPQNFLRAAGAQARYRSRKYEFGSKQPRLLVCTLCE